MRVLKIEKTKHQNTKNETRLIHFNPQTACFVFYKTK